MAEERNFKQYIDDIVKLKAGELKLLLRSFKEYRNKVDGLLRHLSEIEDELCRDPEEEAAAQRAYEEQQLAAKAAEQAKEIERPAEQEAPAKPEKPDMPDKPEPKEIKPVAESAEKPAPKAVKDKPKPEAAKEAKAVEPVKKEEPKIRRINLDEINRKYNVDRRQERPHGARDANRPSSPRPTNVKSILGGKPAAPDIVKSEPTRKLQGKQKDGGKQTQEGKKTMNKRTLIRKGYIEDTVGEERMGSRKLVNKKNKDSGVQFLTPKIEKASITTENLTVKILSEKIGKPSTEIIKQLMLLGIMANINSVVDFSTMELVASELGVEIDLKLTKSKEEVLADIHSKDEDSSDKLVKRPPIVTVMGHVDHGKTSLLDAIKHTRVASGEAGSITQHIGAYTIDVKKDKITFIDTPGHEAFTAMRARGATVTDITILVVAADDGVMPQTIEAISHAKAANVPIIVAINKIDKQGANLERIKQQLTEHGVLPEEWGGDSIFIGVSAKTHEGIDKLLESILLVAEMQDLKANPDRKAMGTVIEARLDRGKGPVATVIVNNGTLRVGDFLVSGTCYGKVRAMHDDKGKNVKEAYPSYAIEVLGLGDAPFAGDIIHVVDDEKLAKQVADERAAKLKNEQLEINQKVSLDDMFSRISEGQLKSFNIIVKADVQGSVEALKASLLKLGNEEVKIRTIHGGVGAINKSDIMLAEASGAVIIGFNVKPDSNETKQLADASNIDIRLYSIIYEALNDIELAVNGMLTPTFHEEKLGRIEVRNVFKISANNKVIAGSYVLSGKAVRGCKVRVLRNEEMIFDGTIEGLKRFKDDVKEVASGYECGVSIGGFTDVKEGDILEMYSLERDKK